MTSFKVASHMRLDRTGDSSNRMVGFTLGEGPEMRRMFKSLFYMYQFVQCGVWFARLVESDKISIPGDHNLSLCFQFVILRTRFGIRIDHYTILMKRQSKASTLQGKIICFPTKLEPCLRRIEFHNREYIEGALLDELVNPRWFLYE